MELVLSMIMSIMVVAVVFNNYKIKEIGAI